MLQIISALEAWPGTAALATLVSASGSSYRRAGARMLWRSDGARFGGISGGCLEEDLAGHCREVAADGAPRMVVYDTRDENDLVWGTGTGCDGVVRVFVEPVRGVPASLAHVRDAWARREAAVLETRVPDAKGGSYLFSEYMPPPVALVIFGGGGDARTLARMASELGWLAETRGARAGVPEPDGRMAVVVMTHRRALDAELLRRLLPFAGRFAYVGALGPRRRTEKILAELGRGDAPPSLHAPAGLDLGGDTPELVALSIIAEIQTSLSGRDARPLRERAGAIHDA